ncbi:MAG: hypothetical protein KME40_22670 [Komarekiella atlantica HA4396-MV6]|nr:hypothetical protein [Komarekiella atlantica HA4396-MV6]
MTTLAAPGVNDQQEFANQFLEQADDFFPNIQKQATTLTRAFLSFCQGIYAAKITSQRKQWRQTKESLGWDSTTETPYAKIGEWFMGIEPSNLELLDINTLKTLCNEKYRPIIERLQVERLTVKEVRGEMTATNKALKKPASSPPVLEWRRTKGGSRSLIARLDAEAGAEFEAKYKASGQPLPLFVRSLLQRESRQTAAQTLHKAQQEFDAYIQQQSEQVSNVEWLVGEVQRFDRLITEYQDSQNPSERMVARVAQEDKTQIQQQLMQLQVVA